jgi:general secretion pathway protein G
MRARARLRSQRGFTLIEMLVVLTILGILGCIVTMSMIGLTSLAQSRANAEELMTVQSAMNFMIMDQQVNPEDACAGSPAKGTNNMARFPDTTDWTGQGSQAPVRLYPHYLRKQLLNRAYVCSGGTVQPAT